MPAPITDSETQVNTATTGDQWDPTITMLADGGWIVVWMGRVAIGSEVGVFAQRYAADGTPVGGEFQVNSASADQWESGPAVAALPDGGWIVVWYAQSPHGGPSPEDTLIYMQRYDAAGTPSGEVQVNTPDGYIAGTFPEVAVLADGGWVIVWHSRNSTTDADEDIYGQRYDAAGTPIGGEFQINGTSSGMQIHASVTALDDGGWIVTWMSEGQDGSGWGVYAQRYNSDGSTNGGETLVTTTTAGNQMEPHLATLNGGGWVITWSSTGQDGSGAGIFAQRYDSTGAPVGGEFQVNTITANDQLYATVEALPDGGFAVTWLSLDGGTDPYGGRTGNVYLQRFDAAGNPVGGETLVGVASEGSFSNLSTRLAALPDGTLVVTWGQYGTDGSGYGVYARTFDAPTNVINGTEGDDVLVGTPGDDVINGLGGNDTIDGLAGNDTLNGGDGNDMLTGGSGDDFIDGGEGNDTASWIDTVGPISVDLGSGDAAGPDGNDTLTGIENVFGSESGDTIVGNGDANLLAGFGGDDLIFGSGGGDSLGGGDGNDVLYGDGDSTYVGPDGHDLLDGGNGDDYLDGGAGDDLLIGGAGNDTLDGGGGNDTASYADSAGAVDVVLYAGFADEYDAAGLTYLSRDSLLGIENVIGSPFDDTIAGNGADNVLVGLGGNDVIFGLAGNDVLDGGSGNDFLIGARGNDILAGGDGHDTLRGGLGDDVIDGGAGFDRVSNYGSGSTSGVTISLLLQGAPQDTGHGWDTLVDIEALSGSPYNDTLIGDHSANWLIAGGESNDTLIGNDGDDLLEVGGGIGGGNHSLQGGFGSDTVSFLNLTNLPGMGPVSVSLELQGAAQDTGIGMMTLSEIENLSGSFFDDTLTGDGGANVLSGHVGNDTLTGGDGDDQLYGDGALVAYFPATGSTGPITFFSDITTTEPSLVAGDDTLYGGKGDDMLYGGGGNDVMTGGQGNDRFVIEAGSGDDRITDFKSKQDLIVFDPASGVDDFADLTLTQVGKDTLITWGTADSLLLEGVKADKLSASDFGFGGSASASLFSDEAGRSTGLGFADPQAWSAQDGGFFV